MGFNYGWVNHLSMNYLWSKQIWCQEKTAVLSNCLDQLPGSGFCLSCHHRLTQLTTLTIKILCSLIRGIRRKPTESKTKRNKIDEELPLLMSIFMGLQHCMAMVGGLITPPLVVFKFTVCGFAQGFCPDLVQVSADQFCLRFFPPWIRTFAIATHRLPYLILYYGYRFYLL